MKYQYFFLNLGLGALGHWPWMGTMPWSSKWLGLKYRMLIFSNVNAGKIVEVMYS